ncbi:hypothetical protein SAMN04488109_1998 [Chryseolinea serpens]|jgi:hypothetical protein|uniref:Uncharacterized protein n=1 Tax=Chryseolinea serpens TaxID=947013 RepID=A0A1M5MXX2_9BACT|nr:hypothetical protein [Chryseolinea serpens]SHG82065.1 hypothetical protein SAMN04488109_1998 [Chryseolinea serpens]
MDILNSMTPTVYLSLWNKYRPVIVHLMLAAGDGPQQYKLFSHEFKALAAKEKTFSFVLQAFRGKSTNGIRKSFAAQDLLSMLNTSRKASEQMEKYGFEFKLDSQFVLHVTRLQPAEEQA